MNPSSFTSILAGLAQTIVPAVIAYAVGRGWVSQSSAADVGAAILTLLAAGWSGFTTRLSPPAAK